MTFNKHSLVMFVLAGIISLMIGSAGHSFAQQNQSSAASNATHGAMNTSGNATTTNATKKSGNPLQGLLDLFKNMGKQK